jgi:hypothetical protein
MKSITCIAALLLMTGTATAQIGLVGACVHETVVRAGDRYRGVITIANAGRDPVEVTLRVSDFHLDPDGEVVLEPAGVGKRSNALWVILATRHATIAAGDSIDIPYGVRVPSIAPAPLDGTYRSLIVVESTSVGRLEIVTHIGDPRRQRIMGGQRAGAR